MQNRAGRPRNRHAGGEPHHDPTALSRPDRTGGVLRGHHAEASDHDVRKRKAADRSAALCSAFGSSLPGTAVIAAMPVVVVPAPARAVPAARIATVIPVAPAPVIDRLGVA